MKFHSCRIVPVSVKAALLSLAVMVCGSAWASSSGPISPFPITGAYSAHHTEDRDHVSIIEFSGNYDKELGNGDDNVEPRAVVAREFYRTHPDNYDFLVVFSTFEFETGEAVAFHWGIQNQVQGLNLPISDVSDLFGSAGKLKGFIDMAAMTRYETNPMKSGFDFTLSVLAHEVLHQWGPRVRFLDTDDTLSEALIGHEDGHWSYLLDSDASLEYGADWKDNGDGTFTSVAIEHFFNPLDLYLMGYYKPEEVPPFYLIENPDIDKNGLPRENVTISGTKRQITIDDIIAAEGPRIPSADQAQHDYRFAFILLTGQGETVTSQQILALNNVRREFMTRYAILTGGRGIAQVYPEAMPTETVGTPDEVTGGPIRTTSANLEEALAWLRGLQQSDGSWSDKEATRFRDTVVALETLTKLDSSFTGLSNALTWLEGASVDPNLDYLARYASLRNDLGLSSHAQLTRLAELQNRDGGWGLGDDYGSTALDTALALKALASNSGSFAAAIDDAVNFLTARRNTDGGWSGADGGPSRTSVTVTVLRALKAAQRESAIDVTQSLAWIAGKQNADGGFGDSPSTVHDTANVLNALITLEATDQIRAADAANYLMTTQSESGSWAGSAYTTALAVSTLKRFNFPNWAVDPVMVATPDTPFDGDRVAVRITVRNDSHLATPAGTLRLYDGDPDVDGVQIGDDMALPLMAPGEGVELTPLWDTYGREGEQLLVAVVDPDDTQLEMSERDNRAEYAISVAPAPAGVDLAVEATDISVSPAQPDTLPSTLALSASVRNTGTTDASNALVQVWRGNPGDGELVGEDILNILGRSSVAVNHAYTLTTTGSTTFYVVLDPANQLLEENEANNSASATISTVPTIDLEVSAGDITVSDNPAYVGDDITFTVNIHNRGTLDAPSATVLFQVTDGSTTEEIQSTSIQVDAGQSVSHNVIWRVDMEGSLVFSAQLDTAGMIPETDEGNNSATSTLSAGLASGPNLAVDHRTLIFSPTPALEDHDLQLSAEVSNTGADPATDIEVTFYNGDPDLGGTQIGATQLIGALNSGESTTVSVVWPQLADSMDKLLFVVVDPQDQIAEFYEEDNRAFNTVTVESLPDLATSTGDLMLTPAFPKVGENVTLTVRVSNLGQQSADNVVVRAYDGDPAEGGVPIGTDQTIASLPGLIAETVQFSWSLSTAGTARPVVVQIDPEGTVTERVTANNTASRQIAAQDGDFYVTEPYISPNGDGIKESTQFFFRLQSAANVTVAVVNSKDETVRELTSEDFQNTTGANVLWDGLDGLGRLVDDGKYRLRVLDENDVVLGQAAVTLDTNQSPILDSIGTPYQSFTNLTCSIVNASVDKVTDDENSIILYNFDDPRGIYRMGSNGTDLRPIITRDALGGDSIYSEYASNDGETIIFRRGGSDYVQSLFVIDNRNNVPRAITLPGTIQRQVLGISPDGSTAYTYTNDGFYAVPTDGVSQSKRLFELQGQWLSDFKQSSSGRYVSVKLDTGLIVADTRTDSTVFIDRANFSYGYYSWSPDEQRIAITNPENWRMDLYTPQGVLLQSVDSPWAVDSTFQIQMDEPQWSLSGTQFAARIGFTVQDPCGAGYGASKAGAIVVFDTVRNSSEIVASLTPLHSGCDSYHISTWDGANWVERGELHYDLHYSNQTFSLREYLPDPDGEYKVRVRQSGLEAAHVDHIALQADRKLLEAISATDTASSDDLLPQVAHADHEVQDLHEAEMEVRWSDVPPVDVSLVLLAREENLSNRNAIPFSYPENHNGNYSYTLDGNGFIKVDGLVSGEDHPVSPLFDIFSKPGTGHPPAHVYGYMSSDDNYLYGALDFTVDNTLDGEKDWASLWVRTSTGWREFRVSVTDTQWGVAGFTRTDKVSYTHKYYEFKIPQTELGAAIGDTLDVRFQAYGTAAIVIGEDDGYLPVSRGDLLWAPGDEALIFEGDYVGNWVIYLDDNNRVEELFSDWSYRPSYLRFVPSGRQLLFSSGEGAQNPNSVCYGMGWNDTWSFKSLLNLTADLRAIRSSQSGGIKLSGTATDINFAGYQLDYASVDTPETWRPIAPASGQSQVDEQFTTWVPPGPGAYFVRLTVTDLAGNERKFVTRVYWSDTPSITDLYRAPRYISPNGDGTQDEAAIHYRVLEPVHLEFYVYNSQGDLIRTLKRDHTLIGAEFDLLWDGRDSNGLVVEDGDYRLVVQNYEFSISVDSTAPSLSLVKNNAYQKYCIEGGACFVNSYPAITWSIDETKLSTVTLEKSADFSTATWVDTLDLAIDLYAEEQDGMFFPSLAELAATQYRLTAVDQAGNQQTIYASDADEEVFVERFGNHAANQRLDECTNPLDPAVSAYDPAKIACVNSIGGYYEPLMPVLYNPIDVMDGDIESSANISSGDIRFLVKESTKSKIVQAYVLYKIAGTATWTEEPITTYLAGLNSLGSSKLPATETANPGDSIVHIVWQPQSLSGGSKFNVRLRTVDSEGNEHYSNTFSFITNGYSFNGLLPSPLSDVYHAKIEPILPDGLQLSDLFDEWFLWGEQFIGNKVATVDLYVESEEDTRYATPQKLASVSHPGQTFMFRTKELQACKAYKGYIVLKGEQKLDGTSDFIGRTQSAGFSTPCMNLNLSVETAFAESCGDPSPNHLSVSMIPERLGEVFTSGGSELKLLTLFTYTESDEEDVVFNVNQPESRETYRYDIDTTDLVESRLKYYARLINEDDDAITLPVDIIIDHTPPTIDITYPLDGQKVCGVQFTNSHGDVFSTVQIEGVVYDKDGFHLEVDINTQLKHVSRDSGLCRSLDSFCLERRSNEIPPSAEFHLGPNASGSLAQAINEHGYVEANIRAYDHAGFQQCASRTFEIDGEVELYSMSLSNRVISPNADTIADNLDIGYSVGESGHVDVQVYPAHYDSEGKLQVENPPVKSIVTGTPVLPGSTSVTWDGTDDGGMVVADGLYAIGVIMRDGCDQSKRLIRLVEVDTIPPEVSIAYPKSGDPLTMLVEIIGSVSDAHFQNYVVRYGVGQSPEEWAIVTTETQSVDNSIIAAWNTYGLSGDYSLRITAQDTVGNQKDLVIPLNIAERTELIQYLEPQPRMFSPNGDGHKESSSIRIGLDEDVFLTVKVMDESLLIQTLTEGQSVGRGSLILSWDGRNEQGNIVPDGPYQLHVTATSQVNALLTQEEHVILIVDSTPPQIDLLRPDNGYIDKAGSLIGNISDVHLTSYRIELQNKQVDATWQEIATGTSSRLDYPFAQLSTLEEGQYAVQIQAVDEAENKTLVSYDFVIDDTPPDVTLNSLEHDIISAAQGLHAITGAITEEHLEVYGLRYGAGIQPSSWSNLAAGTTLPLATPIASWDVSMLSDGDYVLELSAADKAGLETTKNLPVVIDNTPPSIQIDGPDEGGYIKQATVILGSVSDAHFGSYQVDIAPGSKGTSNRWSLLGKAENTVQSGTLWNWQALPPDGLYTLRIKATDTANNTSEALREYVVDTTPPAMPSGLTYEVVTGSEVHLSWNANSEVDLIGYHVYRDGNRLTSDPITETDFVDPAVLEGRHEYTISAVDQAEWESEHSEAVELVIDLTPPNVKLTVPADNALVKGYLDIEGTAYSVDDFKQYRLYIGQGVDPSEWQLLRQSPVPTIADVLAQWDTFALPEGSQYTIRLEAEDINGNLGQDRITAVVDNLPPAAPLGLSAALSGSDVTLTWNPSPESDLLGYLVFRDDRLVNAIGAAVGDLRPYVITGITYDDTALPDGSYVYTLIAIDQAGNMSEASVPATVDIDTHAPHGVIVTPEEAREFDNTLYVLAETEDKDVDHVQFQYRAQGASTWEALGASDTSVPFEVYLDPSDLGLTHGNYEIQALATDVGGQTDLNPTPVNVTYKDLTRPDSVQGVQALTDGGNVTLTWDANTESDLAGYHVERTSDGGTPVRITVTPVTETTYVDPNLADGLYDYAVVAIDTSENEADSSATVNAQVYTPVLDQPYTPISALLSDFTGTAGIEGSHTALAELSNNTETVDLGSVTVDTNGMFTFPDVALTSGLNTLRVTVTDDVGNRSKPAEAGVYSGQVPSAPTGVSATAVGFDVDVIWNANPETTITGYRVFRNGEAVLGEEAASVSTATASSYYVGAYPSYAKDGNAGTYWSPIRYSDMPLAGQWLALELASASQVTGLKIDWQSLNYRAIDFRVQGWSAEAGAWITIYEIHDNPDQHNLIHLDTPYRTDQLRLVIDRSYYPETYYRAIRLAEVSVLHQPLVTATQLQETVTDGVHQYAATAVNALGFESQLSTASEVAVGDVVAPDPVSLTATVNGADVTLVWTASSASDTHHYLIYRDGVLIATQTDLSALQLIDPALPNGLYAYTVTVVDAVGNESQPSNVAQATIAGMVPAVPQGLVVMVTPEGGALDLMWGPGTGGSATAYYEVMRSELSGASYTLVASTTDSHYRDMGLSNGTAYYYVIRAVDILNNRSAPSEEGSGVPTDSNAPPVWLHYPTSVGRVFTTHNSVTAIMGYSEPEASVKVTRNGLSVGSTTATQTQAEQIYEISAYDHVVLSPNSRYIAYQSDYASIVLADLLTQTQVEIPLNSAYAESSIAWSFDGESVVFSDESVASGRRFVRRYDLETQQTEDLTDPSVSDLGYAQLSPSGQQLAGFGEKDGQYGLWLVDVSSQVWTLLVPDSLWYFDGWSLRWSPDGSRLSYLRTYPSMSVELVHTGTSTQQVLTAEAGSSVPVWSPDGSTLAYVSVSSGTSQVWRYDVNQGIAEAVTTGGQHLYPAWGPSGQRMAYYAADENNVWSITVRDLQSDVETVLTGPTQGSARFPLQWSKSGTIGLYTYGEYHTLVPAGYFELQGVNLSEGDNVFYAEAVDEAGNWSAPSEAVTVVYDTSAFTDLAIASTDVRVLPAAPQVGEPVRVTAIVHNPSAQASPTAQLTVVAIDPTGSMTTLLNGNVLDAIPASGSQAVTADWMIGTETGLYTLVVTIDAEGAIAETSEVNNTAFSDFLVSEGGDISAKLSLSSDKDSLRPDETLTVNATVTNGGEPFTGQVSLRIEDPDGYLVETLITEPVAALSYGASQQVTAEWLPGRTFAGDYVVHALLSDSSEKSVDDQTIPLRLLGSSEITASISADSLSYAPNTLVHVVGTYHYVAGNSPLEGVSAIVQLRNAQDLVLAETALPLGSLLPDNLGNVDLYWNTETSPAGQYTATIEVRQDGFSLAHSQTALTVELGDAQLVGEIAISEALIGSGTPQTVQYTVRNISNVALNNQPVIISLYDADQQAILQTEQVTPSIGVGETFSGSVQMATDTLSLKDYTVMLQAEVHDNDGQIKPVTLKTTKFKVVDRSLPLVRIDVPTESDYLSAETPLTVYASDDLSQIAKVEAMIDGGAWKTLPALNEATNTWGEILKELADGVHSVQARATDGAGNMAETSLTEFTMDTTAPTITLSGVEEWAHYNVDVTPVITVADANPVTTLISLNGISFESGTTLSEEGDHTLAVQAEDAAGNLAFYEIAFEIDKTSPLVELTTPIDGTTSSDTTTDVAGTTEPYTIVYLDTGNFQDSQLIAEDGSFLFEGVSLSMGANEIKVYAEDRAGNTSPTVAVTVTRQPEIQATLEGAIVPTGEVLIWYPAKAKGTHPHEPDENDHHGYGDEDDEDSSSHGLCRELGVTKKRQRSIEVREDWKSHHYEDTTTDPLLTMVEETLQSTGKPYHIASDEHDFVEKLRTHRYSTVMFIDIMHKPIWEGHTEWHYHAQWPLSEHAQEELLGTIASGTGLLWIKTHPGHGQALADGLGMRIFGTSPHLNTVSLPEGPATVVGDWEASGFGLSMRTQPGTAVGELSPSGRPAMMISRHGNGNVAVMAFNPAMLTDQQAAKQILNRSLDFAVAIEVPTIPGIPVGIRWTTQQLVPPMELEFEESLPLDLRFISALKGVIENDQLARWQDIVETEQYDYDAVVTLPDTLGTYSISGKLSEMRDGLAWELIQDTLDVTVSTQKQDVAVDLIEALNALDLRRHDAQRRSAALWFIQLAITKETDTVKDIEYAIRKLLIAQKFISALDQVPPEIHRLFGQLLSIYQLAWVEQKSVALTTDLSPILDLDDFSWLARIETTFRGSTLLRVN